MGSYFGINSFSAAPARRDESAGGARLAAKTTPEVRRNCLRESVLMVSSFRRASVIHQPDLHCGAIRDAEVTAS